MFRAPFFARAFKAKPSVDAAGNDGLVVDDARQHLRELRSIAGEGDVCHPCTATLHPQGADENGPASVQVTINNVRVGRLCHRDAARYLRKHGAAKLTCRAAILGGGCDGWELGVWLDMRL